ncbi:hypothetical protein KQX54_020790 [Cotesia glomerata]|uniref:Uncharacterized protein n=1 Tax=Cotesia glomerata TaxID=32391 RepID=A0AAV7I2B3_COTGL|nr:hypothetical protein KQX54_020790 [Cotesia glomerata]
MDELGERGVRHSFKLEDPHVHIHSSIALFAGYIILYVPQENGELRIENYQTLIFSSSLVYSSSRSRARRLTRANLSCKQFVSWIMKLIKRIALFYYHSICFERFLVLLIPNGSWFMANRVRGWNREENFK